MFWQKVPFSVVAGIIILAAGFGSYAEHRTSHESVQQKFKTIEESDSFVRFDLEGYDIVQANYWQKAPDSDLSQLFALAIQKAANATTTLPTPDRAGLARMLAEVLKGKSNDEKKKIAVDTLTVALYNMAPIGRNGVLSTAAQVDLHNEVNNVNPNTNLYTSLGVADGASPEKVAAAYESKKAELDATTSPDKAKQIEAITYAKKVLEDAPQKALYDTTRIEPTMFVHQFGRTLYLYITKMSPTTQSEFEQALLHASADLNSLVIDLRGNIGGDLTFSQTFLGLFFGPNQYAFDLYHRNTYDAQRTLGLAQIAGLSRFREMAVLTDGMTQSTSEVIAASLKRSHRAILVGVKTRGWGSVEHEFPIQTVIDPGNQYALLMVVDLTVRDDAQPIEGNGVLPDIDTSNPAWKDKLSDYFFTSDIQAAVRKTASGAPIK